MDDLIQSSRKFEKLVQKLLKHRNFTVYNTTNSQADFLIKKDILTWAVEVKYYKTQRAQLKLLNSAVRQIQYEREKNPELLGMLITSCLLTKEQKSHLSEMYDLIILDRQNLFHYASTSPELTEELYAILEIDPSSLSAFVDDFYKSEEEPEEPYIKKELDLKQYYEKKPSKPKPVIKDIRGSELRRELSELAPGRPNWSKFEKLCEKILKYLFEDHLAGWSKQHGTDDDLNRFDYVCRIKPSTDFWNFILHQLHSRYIVFEFKNYEEPIRQGQVLTTEKYLLEKGLRRVAIMLTRKGGHASAIKMAQGAMRESGKLILILDDQHISQMIAMKEKGSDPTDLLFDITDKFLLSLPR